MKEEVLQTRRTEEEWKLAGCPLSALCKKYKRNKSKLKYRQLQLYLTTLVFPITTAGGIYYDFMNIYYVNLYVYGVLYV